MKMESDILKKVKELEVRSTPTFPETDLADAYEKYIVLLNAEINELLGIAMAHGWQSSRVEEGNQARERITAAHKDFWHQLEITKDAAKLQALNWVCNMTQEI